MSKDKTGWNKYRRGPARTNDTEITLQIDSLGNNGDGVGRYRGQVIFVPFTLPGERVKVKPVVRRKSFVRAQVVQTLESSEQRQTPPCPYFGECGGCDWQHVPYAMQLDAKIQHLRDALQRIGHQSDALIQAIVPSDSAFHYRNRIQGVLRNGRFHFKQRGSDQLVEVNSCAIAEESINAVLASTPVSDLEGRVEISVSDDDISIVALNDDHSTDTGFRQVNTRVSEHLARMINAIAEQHQGKRIIDLYCGQGNWSIDMARHYPESTVIGVDASERNIRLARETALKADIPNVRFQHGRVENLLKSLPLDNSFCIVDPPRAGLDEKTCLALCENPPDRIVYISCHPASLARDLAMLTNLTFRLDAVTPLDMFPQTAHLECVSILSRVDATAV